MKKLEKIIEETEQTIHAAQVDSIKQDFKKLQATPLTKTEQAYLNSINEQINELAKQKGNAIIKAKEKFSKCKNTTSFDLVKRERDAVVASCDSQIANLNMKRKYLADIFREIEAEEAKTTREIASIEQEIAVWEKKANDADSFDSKTDAEKNLFTLRRDLASTKARLEEIKTLKVKQEDPRKAKLKQIKTEFLKAVTADIDEKFSEMIVILTDALKTLAEMDEYENIFLGCMLTGKSPEQIRTNLQLIDIYTERRKMLAMAEKIEQFRKEVNSL